MLGGLDQLEGKEGNALVLRSQALPTEPDMPPLSRGKKDLHPWALCLGAAHSRAGCRQCEPRHPSGRSQADCCILDSHQLCHSWAL